MELNVKEQTEKLETEIKQLQQQLQQVEQARNNVVSTILKKSGALELLQDLEAEKKPIKEKSK